MGPTALLTAAFLMPLRCTYSLTQCIDVPCITCDTQHIHPCCAHNSRHFTFTVQGAAHLRDVFGRMGFNDQEIVALSGAHTLGRCHMTRSGFDGPWSSSPLTFNNDYFINLMDKEWQPREWEGPFQYEDVATRSLMMLPTDMALRTDPEFAKTARLYADDEQAFFRDFSAAFSKLLALNCPAACSDFSKETTPSASVSFRENAMHGSIEKVRQFKEAGADVHEVDASSGRNALHKAAYWGHDHVVKYLLGECGVGVNAQDSAGDTALHDVSTQYFFLMSTLKTLLIIHFNQSLT